MLKCFVLMEQTIDCSLLYLKDPLKSPITTVTGQSIGEQGLTTCTCHHFEMDVTVTIKEPLYFVLCVYKQVYLLLNLMFFKIYSCFLTQKQTAHSQADEMVRG